MGRLDRLVRAAGPCMDDDEVLLGSVLGRLGQGRAVVALVATDRGLVLVRERFGRQRVERIPYGEVTAFEREDGPTLAVEIVTAAGRHRVETIVDTPSTRVALRLAENRVAGDVAATLRTAAMNAGTSGSGARVRIVT